MLEHSPKERAALLERARSKAKRAPYGKRTAARRRLERTARDSAWKKRRADLASADGSCNLARAQLAEDVATTKKRRAAASPAKKAAGRRGAERMWERADLQAVDVEKTLTDDPETADVAAFAAREFRAQPQRWLREAKTKKAYAWELYAHHVREHIGDVRRRMHAAAAKATTRKASREAEERARELADLYDEDAYEAAERAAQQDDEGFDPDAFKFGDDDEEAA